MFLEGFIGDELRRLRDEEHRRINPDLESFYASRTAGPRRTLRGRVGTALIRAGARLSGLRVDDCLENPLNPAAQT